MLLRQLSAWRLFLVIPAVGCVPLTAGVVPMGLGHVAGGDGRSALLSYGDGIAVVAAALALFMNMGGKRRAGEARLERLSPGALKADGRADEITTG